MPSAAFFDNRFWGRASGMRASGRYHRSASKGSELLLWATTSGSRCWEIYAIICCCFFAKLLAPSPASSLEFKWRFLPPLMLTLLLSYPSTFSPFLVSSRKFWKKAKSSGSIDRTAITWSIDPPAEIGVVCPVVDAIFFQFPSSSTFWALPFCLKHWWKPPRGRRRRWRVLQNWDLNLFDNQETRGWNKQYIQCWGELCTSWDGDVCTFLGPKIFLTSAT